MMTSTKHTPVHLFIYFTGQRQGHLVFGQLAVRLLKDTRASGPDRGPEGTYILAEAGQTHSRSGPGKATSTAQRIRLSRVRDSLYQQPTSPEVSRTTAREARS